MSEQNELQTLIGDISQAKLLIVDDMNLMRQMIGLCLQKDGFTNISYATDGDEALEMIANDPPDLVVLDINMPRMSGYEVCKTLRANKLTKSLPILVQSASETAEERTQVFEAGATDFVSKPINQPELLARVRMHLTNRFLIRNLSSFHETMRSELSMAREMQEDLLPDPEYLSIVSNALDIEIESSYKASFELGGDLWGCCALSDDKLGFFVLDVSGHGVGSALNTFRIHATMSRFTDEKLDPKLFLTSLNAALVDSFPTGQFATMFYGVIDTKTKILTYAGAGTPRPMIVNGSNVRLLNSEGVPVAIIKSAEYENHTEQLKEGDSLFCYSDVLIETKTKSGEFLGEDGLVKMVKELSSNGPRDKLVANVLKEFYSLVPESLSEALPDDLTAVGLHL